MKKRYEFFKTKVVSLGVAWCCRLFPHCLLELRNFFNLFLVYVIKKRKIAERRKKK